MKVSNKISTSNIVKCPESPLALILSLPIDIFKKLSLLVWCGMLLTLFSYWLLTVKTSNYFHAQEKIAHAKISDILINVSHLDTCKFPFFGNEGLRVKDYFIFLTFGILIFLTFNNQFLKENCNNILRNTILRNNNFLISY